MTHVGYLALSTRVGGAATSLSLLLEALQGFEKHLFLAEPSEPRMLERLARFTSSIDTVPMRGIHHYQGMSCSSDELERIRAESVEPCRQLIARLRERQVELLHVNTTIFAHLLRPIREALPALRIVTHAREVTPRAPGDVVGELMIREIRECSDAIVVISDNELPPFREHPDATVIRNPFDFSIAERASGERWRAAHGIGRDTILVGMLGAYYAAKGQLDLIEAIRLLPPRADVRFPIVGHPSPVWWKVLLRRLLRWKGYSAQVERSVRESGLGERVLLVRQAQDPWDILAALDVVVRPSRSGDPWGRDIIEAMAFGKPVVATGTSTFYVAEGETGFLVPPRDPAALAERIRRLIEDPALRRALGERGRERVRALCDHEQHAARIAEVYRRVLARGR